MAIAVMIAMERYADGRLDLLIRHFRVSRLIAEADLPAFSEALGTADRRSSSAFAEASILAVALVLPSIGKSYVITTAGSSWEGTWIAGEIVLSWAGEISRFVSTPLFVFLVLRWLWRFRICSALLWRLSRLSLRLTPLHPDRAAGLGFLAIYPGVFSGLVFALGCVVASIVHKELSLVQHGTQSVGIAMLAWLVMVLLCFVGPLLAFTAPLYRVRERALLDYGRLATHHHHAFERKWLGEPSSGEDLLGSADPSSAADLNSSVEAAQGLRVIPMDRFALIQLVAAAGIPLLAVVITQTQLLTAAKWIIGALL